MAIQMRRGQLADYDPTRMRSGEFGVSIDSARENQKVKIAFRAGVDKTVMCEEDYDPTMTIDWETGHLNYDAIRLTMNVDIDNGHLVYVR